MAHSVRAGGKGLIRFSIFRMKETSDADMSRLEFLMNDPRAPGTQMVSFRKYVKIENCSAKRYVRDWNSVTF